MKNTTRAAEVRANQMIRIGGQWMMVVRSEDNGRSIVIVGVTDAGEVRATCARGRMLDTF